MWGVGGSTWISSAVRRRGRYFVETATDLDCIPTCVSRTIPVVLLNFDIEQKELITCKHIHLVFDGRLPM